MVNRSDLGARKSLSTAPRTLRGPFARWPRAGDALLAIVIYVAAIFVTSEGPNEDFAIRSLGEVPMVAFIILAVASGALYWRRSQPLAVFGVTLVAIVLPTAVDHSELSGLTTLVALYSVGRYVTNDRWSHLALGGAFVMVGSHAFTENVTAAEIGFGLFVMFLVWYIGRRIQFHGERAARREREQVAEARRVVAEERTRIARELHDVVAHRVSLMTVQAGAAKTVAAVDPEGALRAMEAVEQTGRQALDELRHLLGVLRPEAEVDGLGPQPGLADIPRLIDQFEAAGLDVSLTMNGVPTDLPARVDLFAYRTLQEALTNVLKHAGSGARAEVRLGTDHDEIVIEVLDNGHGATILPGTGHGIIGMRERALLLGGSLEAGPRPDGGFRVVARLPIGEEPA